jgi:hypothetical protein
VSKSPARQRLLADENTSHRLVGAARRLEPAFPIVHIATWQAGSWLGLDDTTLLIACAEAGLTLGAFDRATLPWHAGHIVRAGDAHGGLILFRRSIPTTDYGQQARVLTRFWLQGAGRWDWENRVVYLPKSI